MFDLQSVVVAKTIAPVDSTGATTDGSAYDTKALGGCREVLCIVQLGNVAANMTTLKIEHSNDNSTWAAVTSGTWDVAVVGLAASADNDTLIAHIVMGGSIRRYLRVTATGGAGATLISAVFIGVHQQKPQTVTERGTVTGGFLGPINY